MIYALPVQNQRLSNHFSKASQFLLFNSQTGDRQWVDAGLTSQNGAGHQCGKKKNLMNLLTQHQVDAVVVRNVGESMLASLFGFGVKVFSTPAIRDLETWDATQLTPVTELSYARPSAKKLSKANGGQSGCGHKVSREPKPEIGTKLQPRSLEKLQRVLKIHR